MDSLLGDSLDGDTQASLALDPNDHLRVAAHDDVDNVEEIQSQHMGDGEAGNWGEWADSGAWAATWEGWDGEGDADASTRASTRPPSPSHDVAHEDVTHKLEKTAQALQAAFAEADGFAKQATFEAEAAAAKDPEDDEALRELKFFAVNDKVDHQTKTAVRFRRETNKSERGDTKEARAAFRRKWAQKAYDTAVERKIKTEEIIDEDIANGSYEPYDIIVEKEGGSGNIKNVDAATNYAQRCIEEGGKWVRFNLWTKRLEYLYIKLGMRSTWAKSWKWQRAESQAVGGMTTPLTNVEGVAGTVTGPACGQRALPRDRSAEAPPPATPKGGRTASTPTSKSSGKRKGDNGAQGGSEKDQESASKKTRKKTALQTNLDLANKLKKQIHDVATDYTNITKSIKNHKAWGWAKVEGNRNDLDTAYNYLDNIQDVFMNDFMLMDMKQLKRTYDDATLTVKLGNISKGYDKGVVALQKEVRKMLELHTVHCANIKTETQ